MGTEKMPRRSDATRPRRALHCRLARRASRAPPTPSTTGLLPGGVLLGAEDVNRDVRRVAHHPAVVARGDREDVSRPQDLVVPVAGHRDLTREHDAEMLDPAAVLWRVAHVLAPSPSRLLGRAAERHLAHP